jgi:Sulfotransferase family
MTQTAANSLTEAGGSPLPPADPTPRGFPDPVFVGGSARSGTHAIGRLIGADPRYHLVGESRFHCAGGGLPDLLGGATSMDAFCERVLGFWWQRGLNRGAGLHRVIDRADLEQAIASFRGEFDRDPEEAARHLVRAVLDQDAARAGKPSWVDISGPNVPNAPVLHRLLPGARFINMVRDGRAVTAAILRKRDMSDDREQAFEHWLRRVERSHAALAALPAGSALTVSLEDFAVHEREATFERLMSFLEVEDPAPMRKYFDEKILPERARVGQWRQRVAPADARWIDRRYRRELRRLRREGVAWIPSPERSA